MQCNFWQSRVVYLVPIRATTALDAIACKARGLITFHLEAYVMRSMES